MFHSHGTGVFSRRQFGRIGTNVIFEKGVLIFHPENIELGNNIYIGHRAILKAYHQNKMIIGNNVWIGQDVFLHSGGGIVIADNVGIGPAVKILTLTHRDDADKPIIAAPQVQKPVHINSGSDIGIGAIILPGVTIGEYSQIGAGAVVTRDIPDYSVAIGVPARVLRKRTQTAKR